MFDNKNGYLLLKIVTQKVVLWLVEELLRYVVAIAVFRQINEMHHDLLVEALFHIEKLFVILTVAMIFILGSVESCLVQELEDFLHCYDTVLGSASLKESGLYCLIEQPEELDRRSLHLEVYGRIFPEINGFHHGKYLFDHMTTILILDHMQNLVWQQLADFKDKLIQEFQALVHGFVECLQTMSPDRVLACVYDIDFFNEFLFLIVRLVLAKLLNKVVAIFVGHENSYVP